MNEIIFFLQKILTFFRLKKMNKAIRYCGMSIISQICSEVNKKNADVFVDYGTLLGIVRDNKLLGWDHDVDFGVHITESFGWLEIESIMHKIGFSKVRQFVYRGEITEQTYKSKDLFIDFFRHYENAGNSISFVYDKKSNKIYPTENSWDVMEFRTPSVETITTIKISDYTINIPCNYEEYLLSIYGDNWRTPDPNWKTGSGPATSFLEGEFSSIENFLYK